MTELPDIGQLTEAAAEDFKGLGDDLFYLEMSFFQKPFQDYKSRKINYKETARLVEIAKRLNRLNMKISLLYDEFCLFVGFSNDAISFQRNDADSTEQNGFVSFDNFKNTTPSSVKILGKIFKVDSWKSVLVIFFEEIIQIAPDFMKAIDKNEEYHSDKQLCFSYKNLRMRSPYLLSNRLYIETALDANFIVMLARKVLTDIGCLPDDIQFKITGNFGKESANNGFGAVTDSPGKNKKNSLTAAASTPAGQRKQDENIKYHDFLFGLKRDDPYVMPEEMDLQGVDTSVNITKDLFKKIVREILDYDRNYNERIISSDQLASILKNDIVSNGREFLLPYVISNVLSYLRDSNFIGYYGGENTKNNAYTILDRDGLKLWANSVLN